MKKNNTFCLLVTLFFGSVCCSNDLKSLNEAGSVVFVNMLYRHGDRTPERAYANDPYSDASYWPEGWGQLTNEGKLRHYKLGRWIRRRYSSLIPSGRYSPDVIYIESTDYDRTLMSAEANLAGMFPPTQSERFTSLEWQPIPVHTRPLNTEQKLLLERPCKKYDREFKKMLESPEVQRFNQEFRELYNYLSKYSGEDIQDFQPVQLLYITLQIEQSRNLILPKWTKGVFPQKMEPPFLFSFIAPTFTETMKRLKNGPLLKEMIGHMKEKRSGELKPNRNFWVYSAHDTTIAEFLNSIGVFKPHYPPFAALVLVELRKNSNNDYFVSVLYKYSDAEPTVLTVSGCTAACPLDKFEQLLRKVIPDDWEKECQSDL